MGKFAARVVRVACLASALAAFALATSAEDWKKGRAPVDSVDAGARTITIDTEIFHVPDSCRIQSESGVRIPLSKIRAGIRPGSLLVPMNEVDFVRYEAIGKKTGWEMVEITVLEGAPQ
jgi:hypothetical protein